MSSLFIGLLGAIIGAAASIGTVWIQSHYQSKRDRLRLVTELALEDYKTNIELAKLHGKRFSAPPVALYLHYHLELAKLLEKGSISSVELEVLMEENQSVLETIKKVQTERQESTNASDA